MGYAFLYNLYYSIVSLLCPTTFSQPDFYFFSQLGSTDLPEVYQKAKHRLLLLLGIWVSTLAGKGLLVHAHTPNPYGQSVKEITKICNMQ